MPRLPVDGVFGSSGGASEAEDGGEQHASVCGERPPGSLAQQRGTGAAGRAETDRASAGTLTPTRAPDDS